MKLRLFSEKQIIAFLALLTILITTGEIQANLNGRWIQHPAFCNRSEHLPSQVDRIIEGERYVYFSVRGTTLDRDHSYFYSTKENIDPIQIFRYDKTKAWQAENILPLLQEMELSGRNADVMNYCPSRGVMAISYDNGAIDFIYDNGMMVNSGALTMAATPQQNFKINSITFDNDQPLVYVAGSVGFAVINIETGELESFHSTDKAVSWAGRLGDSFVIFAGNVSATSYSTSTYIYPVDGVPHAMSSPLTGGSNLQSLMPLTDNTFAAIAIGSSDTKHTIKIFRIDGDDVTSEILMPEATVDNGASKRYRHRFSTDGYVSPSKDGFAVYNSSDIVLIRKGMEFTSLSDFTDKAIVTISRAQLEAGEKNSKAATFDGSKVWLYTYASGGIDMSERGFYFRPVEGSSWGDKSQCASPSAPTSTFALYASWSPVHGLVVRGPGSYYDVGSGEHDLISAYKDGKWKDISYAARNSKYSELTKAGRYVVFDPLNENWIWGNSCLKGMHLIDLGNSGKFVGIGTDNYHKYVDPYPYYYDILVMQKDYATLINFSNVDFDNENRMWVSRYIFSDDYYLWYDYEKNGYIPLYYFTAEERLGMAEGKTPPVHELRVPHTWSFQNSRLIAMKSKGNENYIVGTHLHNNDEFRRFFIYDHAGTPDDPSDDRYAFAEGLFDENGELVSYFREKGIYEDETTGEIWFGTNTGPILINPSDLLDGKKTCRRLRITKRDGMEVDENPFDQIAVNCIATDNLNRKWISSEQGLFCLSADNKELLGYYNMENSPLPSDDIRGVACDMQNGSVFILTERGMVEFLPEGSSTDIAAGEHLSIWPSTVDPSYKGYVNISGADVGATYEIYDMQGNLVRTLGKADTGLLQWDVRDSNGRRVAAGKYNVKRYGVEESHPVIVVD